MIHDIITDTVNWDNYCWREGFKRSLSQKNTINFARHAKFYGFLNDLSILSLRRGIIEQGENLMTGKKNWIIFNIQDDSYNSVNNHRKTIKR